MAESVVTDALKAQLGVDGPETVHEVTSTACRMFARAVGHSDLVFYDRDAATARGYRDILAPPGYLGTPVYLPRDRGEARPPKDPDVPYRRLLNGSTTYEYFEPVCAGDVIVSRTRTTEYQERTGSIGPMLIVFRETAFQRKSDGALVAKMYGNTIHY
ncbi:MAG: MaoC family dehydratase N-terminal domain-containing protein [Chloroflexi bacterium]|nr:MaoC family dehydratase N-terminal domain-containing protein [Chloroflexota bacterium]MQC25435.1 hypothetical protein [Chloroflexota bacterium]MQC48440.1 hypothetical protein [Chloroflexota bacterium]